MVFINIPDSKALDLQLDFKLGSICRGKNVLKYAIIVGNLVFCRY